MASSEEEQEIRRLLDERVRALAQLSWEELDCYGQRTEYVRTSSGREYRVVTGAFWDMEEWASGMELFAKAYAPRGWRKRFPYKDWRGRGGPDDPVPERPATHA